MTEASEEEQEQEQEKILLMDEPSPAAAASSNQTSGASSSSAGQTAAVPSGGTTVVIGEDGMDSNGYFHLSPTILLREPLSKRKGKKDDSMTVTTIKNLLRKRITYYYFEMDAKVLMFEGNTRGGLRLQPSSWCSL